LAETLLAGVALAANSPLEKSSRTMASALGIVNFTIGSIPPPGVEPTSTDSSPNRKSRYERLFDGNAPPSSLEKVLYNLILGSRTMERACEKFWAPKYDWWTTI
jgi:hypothetical protein